jgi:hypothetical protein
MAVDFSELCGWGPKNTTKKEHELFVCGERDKTAAAFATPFFIAGQQTTGAGKSVRLWKIYEKVTGKKYNTGTPQLLGDCVAAASEAAVRLLSCAEIADGQTEKYRSIFRMYHYAVGRVIIGKNRLKGGDGSIGSWQAEAHAQYGVISPEEIANLPAYSKENGKAWGDDRKIDGVSFRDFLERGDDRPVRSWSPVTAWEQLRDGLWTRKAATIAGTRGYTMKPNRSGFHMPSGSWPHQMHLLGYSETARVPWVAIGNQWGDVHGEVIDTEIGEPFPRGVLVVPIEEFVRSHLRMAATEAIVMSNFEGFPGTVDWSEFA